MGLDFHLFFDEIPGALRHVLEEARKLLVRSLERDRENLLVGALMILESSASTLARSSKMNIRFRIETARSETLLRSPDDGTAQPRSIG
jgi:hypothetical protein